MNELILTQAHVVMADRVLHRGTVCVRDGLIADVSESSSTLPNAIDLDGDWLLPGLVEIHTDNLERHVSPRPKVNFPMASAVQAHDAEIAAAGITTVFNAIGVGDPFGDGFRAHDQSELLTVLDRMAAADLLRADHRIHVRCELSAGNAQALFEPFMGHPRLALLSLMDHTPGQRQWTDTRHARIYYTGKKGWTEAQFEEELRLGPERQALYSVPQRAWFSAYAREHGLILATHDDTTTAHVDEAVALGATMSEFPTTMAAAQAARHAALTIVAGAPNVIRGGSHSGNVSALSLARTGLLDMLSSDYVPTSLLQAAWQLMLSADFTPSQALGVVSLNPARSVGLADRGHIAPGLRADLVRVREWERLPCVRQVWRQGRRVA